MDFRPEPTRLARRGEASCGGQPECGPDRSEEHTSELQSRQYLVCRLLLEKKKKARFEDLEGLLIVTLQHLNVRINHLIKCGRVCIAQIAALPASGSTEGRIFRAPRIEQQP